MPSYDVAPEVARVALVVGVIISMLFYERAQLTTGGAIVPAYLALAMQRPIAIVATVGAGLLTHVIMTRFVAKRWILYGRRKFTVGLLVGLGIVLVLTIIAAYAGRLDPALAALTGVGFLVPGILAHDMSRQQVSKTLAAVAITTALLAIFIYVFAAIVEIAPGKSSPQLPGLASIAGYPNELIPIGAALGVVVGMVVFEKLGLRSGGFITAAYLALLGPRWQDLLFTLIATLATYLIVTKVLMPRLLVFGRRKLATMILIGSLVGWSMELVVMAVTNDAFVPWRGLTIATLMVPSLIANDMQRQGVERTMWGTSLTSVGVFAGINLIAAGFLITGVAV